MKYTLNRTCADCKNEDVFEFTKIQSAFGLYDANYIWDKACSKCNSTSCESLQHPYVLFDTEIFDIWGFESDLYFSPQDEEIILAEMHYLPMILNAINESKYLERKIQILIESICVLLYNNTVYSNEYSLAQNKEREKNANVIRPELIKLKEKIKETEDHIMEYIKFVVFPQIGI